MIGLAKATVSYLVLELISQESRRASECNILGPEKFFGQGNGDDSAILLPCLIHNLWYFSGQNARDCQRAVECADAWEMQMHLRPGMLYS